MESYLKELKTNQDERWHLRLRAAPGQRTPSRVLQVFGTQGVEPSEFRLRVLAEGMHLDALFVADSAKARRIGLLLQQLKNILSVVWLPFLAVSRGFRPEEVALSLYSAMDQEADTNPKSEFWSPAPSITLMANQYGETILGHDTEVRLRWTESHLHFLFVCNYQNLMLRAGPPLLDRPTPGLWNNDVAEVFVGPDLNPLTSYCEFELSPRGEWLDLQIECLPVGGIAGRPLNSDLSSSARLEEYCNRWLGYLCVPSDCILPRKLKPGDRLKINFFRSQGSEPFELSWRPTNDPSFHVPSVFGTLILVE